MPRPTANFEIRARRTDSARRRGHAAVEIALMSPWIFLLFLAIFTFGFHAHTLISVENAARVAVMHTSEHNGTADDSAFACFYAVQELRMLPNVGTGVNCAVGCAAGSVCTAGPISVRARRLDGQGGVPFGADGSPASEVTVTYQGIQLFPLPWLMGRLNVARVAQMRL
jgi:hypothetical protein